MRVLRHFAFIDISGFTALTDSGGDDLAVRVLISFRKLLRDVCSRRGVHIEKWLGDGAMLVGVVPKPLLAAVLEIRRAVDANRLTVSLRCGAASGEVIMLEGDDYVGNAVNLAARLCDMAPDGGVLVAPSIADHLPKWGTVVHAEEMPIRGLERGLLVSTIGLLPLERPTGADPVCGIPLTREVSEERTHDSLGREVWFCSGSCREAWEGGRTSAPPAADTASMSGS